jgi:hypothetical protein
MYIHIILSTIRIFYYKYIFLSRIENLYDVMPIVYGTDSDDGFDLSRMRRLMVHLGNPQIGANHGQAQISLTSDRSKPWPSSDLSHLRSEQSLSPQIGAIFLTSDRSKPWPSSQIDLPLPLGSISLTTIFLSLTWGCWLL